VAEDEVKVEQSTRGRALTEFAEALDALRPVVGNWADVLRRIKGLYQEEKARALTNGTAPPTDPPTSTDTLSRAASPNRLIAAGRPPSAPTVEWIARATGADVALFADWRARLERYCTATDEERANINPFLEPRAKPIETDEAIAGASSRPLAGRSGDFPQPGSTVVGESNLARGGRKWLLGAVGAGGVVAVAVAVTLVVSSGHSSDLSAGSGMSTAASSAGAVAGAAHAVLTSRSRLSSSSVLTDPASGPLIVGNA